MGVPAKSGVSGCILLVIPNVCGIAIYSPPLDDIGNSVRGIKLAEYLVEKFKFHNINFSKRNLNIKDKEDFIESMSAISNFDLWQLADLSFKRKNLFDWD